MLALYSAGCSGGNCQATCLDGTITFQLSTPLQGQDVAITVGPPSAADLTADCRPADASIGCAPQSAGLAPHFDEQGFLQSVEMPFFGAGQYRFQIAIDGVPIIDENFQYDLAPVAGVCGTSCYRSTTFATQN